MLSADLLAEITSAINSTRNDVHRNRRAPRIQHSAKTTIYRLAAKPADSALPVQMRDISARGCSFTVRERLARDTNFIIRFSRRDQPPISMLCTVMHCRPQGDQYRIGAEFTCQVDVQRAARVAAESNELDRIRNSILD